MKKEKFEKLSFRQRLEDIPKIEFKEILKVKNPVIFDTNFLFTTFEFKIDVIAQIETVISKTHNLYIYEGTLDELEAIEKKKTKNKNFLPLIAKMLVLYNFKIIKSKQSYVDDQILENINDKVIIATNDKELRKKLWEKTSRVLYMRQKKYLEVK